MASGNPDYTDSIDIASQSIDRVSTVSKAPDGTTAIYKSGRSDNGLTVLHTVAAGKYFYVTAAYLGVFTLDASSNGKLAVRNTGDLEQFTILRAETRASTGNSANVTASINIVPPIRLPAGWDVIVKSDHADLTSLASIVGWEEDT